jgi:dihydrofolate synthase/folylpolyglutamate synthase
VPALRPDASRAEAQAQLRQVEAELLARWPENRPAPSLERIHALTELLGDPQRAYPVIHIAGTNGKTSTARLVDTMLTGFGLRTGRYTSPHLDALTERIAIDGSPVAPGVLAAAYGELRPYVELVDARSVEAGGPPMTFFEVLTGLAFAVFADAPVGVAVVEVGLGGSWDATNVVDAAVSVVTPIGLDHQDYLGSTLEEIAGEKAGIVKAGSTTVLALQPPEAAEVLVSRALSVGATVVREGVDFGVRHRDVAVGGQVVAVQGLGGLYEDLFLPLHGEHQARNLAVAVAAVEAFLGGGGRALDVEPLRDALAGASSPGRLEVVRRSPTVLVDAAHNPAGGAALAAALEDAFTFARLVGVVAMMADKDAYGLLAALEPVLTEVVVTRSKSPRAMAPEELGELAEDVFGPDRVTVVARLDDAIEAAVTLAEQDAPLGGGGVLVTGSVVTVGEARTLLRADRV